MHTLMIKSEADIVSKHILAGIVNQQCHTLCLSITIYIQKTIWDSVEQNHPGETLSNVSGQAKEM